MDVEIRTIRDLVDEMAGRRPESPFLVSPESGRVVTFRGLQEECCVLSAQFERAGLKPGDKVAFLLDNGLFAAQLLLGTMYGGFVPVPLNVRAGASQVSYTLAHCDAKIVFAAEDYDALIKEAVTHCDRPITVIRAGIDDCPDLDRNGTTGGPSHPVQPDEVALLMYTSGSTGQPKAAMHSHRTILAGARNVVCAHLLTDADQSLLVLPLYHLNAEFVTLIPTLMSGGAVVVPHRFVASRFWNWMRDYRCTWSALVPSIISQLLECKDEAPAGAPIRFFRSSSAPLSPSLHREFLERFKLPLVQAMGSTEAGNVFSNPVGAGINKIGSAGKPTGFEIRIINQAGADLPAGEPGEVLIRGLAMMNGYYKDPVATAAALDADGWLHTGDLAYRDADGYFFTIGRSKDLIIKGGMNIAPKQIDEVLESHPAVLEAAAVGVPDRFLGEDLAAFVVLREGKNCEERELLSFCEKQLGHFKTPTRIHFVEDLPKGPSGKVQRRRLAEEAARPTMAKSLLLTDDGHVGGQSVADGANLPVEQIVTEVWRDVLALSEIDPRSNFFALGGHSLLAIQCLARLRERSPLILSLTDFFENPTIAEQIALARKRLNASARANEFAGNALDSQPIPLRDRTLPCPLSPSQSRLWFLEQLNAGVPVYNEAEAVLLEGELDVEALERALNIVIQRHEILRSIIQVVDHQPVAVVQDEGAIELKRIDLRHLPDEQRKAEVDRLLVEEPRRPYQLQSAPGIRATIIKLAAREHVFILMMHHVICDWSSEGVLWRELSELYRRLLRGEPLNLPPPPIQHGDYAAWQKQRMTDGAFESDLEYWEEHLRGAPELLDLPADRPRPAAASYRGTRRRFRIGAALTQSLRDCARREKISLFTLFAAGLECLFYRYTGSEDIVVGVPLADRDRPEAQGLIGFLLYIHALRIRLNGEMTFRELLSTVRREVLDLYNHRSPPFDQVVSRVRPERNLSYSPLVQVLINWRDRDQLLEFIGMEGLAVKSLLAETMTAKFDLSLTLTDCGPEIDLEIEYSTDIFDQSRIERMAGHYQALLEAVAANPTQRLADLAILTDAERRRLLVEWNDTAVAYPKDRCLHELLEEQAMRSPEAVAVVFEGKQLTYRELNARSNQLARSLRKAGIGPDTLVGICVERSLEMVVGLVGILKAGGAYVPMDPEYPAERLKFMLEDAATGVLLTQKHLAERIPATGARIIHLDGDWPSIAGESGARLENNVSGENLAYMIYTSGSTGQPKGAMNTHQGIVNRLLWGQEEYGLGPQDRVIQKTPFSFDISVWEFFWPLITGATLVVARPGGHREAAYLAEVIAREKITTIHFVPSMLQIFLEQGGLSGPASSLKRVLCSGEALPLELQRQFFSCGGAELHNLYGPTEASVEVTYWACRRHSQPSIVPIGRPIANTQIYILDGRLQPLPIGVAGELHIGGIGLARGYHRRPELTAEKFIANPFSDKPGARLYKTGDLARFRADGNVEYLGRLDHQVKIRGFRIELGEIEALLNQHPRVQAAVAVAREVAPGDKRLVAYLVPRNGEVPVAELREFLGAKLPDPMIPSAFVFLEKLPLSHNGKVDRKALPKPEFESPTDVFAPPRTPTEILLADIWAEVLGVARVGIHDNFFHLGGHSLLATRIISKLRNAMGIDLPLRSLFEAPTIAEMGAHIGTIQWVLANRGGAQDSARPGHRSREMVEETL